MPNSATTRRGARSRISIPPVIGSVARRLPLALLLFAATNLAHAVERVYEVLYVADVDPANQLAVVTLTLKQPRDIVRELRFRIDPERYSDFEGEGQLEADGEYLRWTPPETGGKIRWAVSLISQRENGSYDGMITPEWAVFRGDDLVPPVFTRSLKGARSSARLRFKLPGGWSSITPYRKADNGEYLIANQERNFDRPTGWMALGRLGVRWTTIADTRVAVAGPAGQDFRRQDVLAFLRWTLPTFVSIFPELGDRLLVVGAGDPMWRGGLSGPASLFIHADRPLISENGTSTLLHELVHVATSLRAAPGADWIVEGIAEYYALEVLVRSGTTSPRRHRESLEDVSEWGSSAEDLFVNSAQGEVTARAVVIMGLVDEEIREGSNGEHSLDDLVRALSAQGKVSFDTFRSLADDLAGRQVKALKPSHLPGTPES
jgi:hypothetical protein